jgi:hypothetical protein
VTHGRETLPTSGEAIRGTSTLHGGAVRNSRLLPDWLSTPLRIAVFFFFCCYGWLLFRAHSFEQIKAFTAQLLGFRASGPSVMAKPATSALAGIAVLSFLQFFDYRNDCLESFKRWRLPFQGALYATLIFILIMGTSNAPVQFIYFQF